MHYLITIALLFGVTSASPPNVGLNHRQQTDVNVCRPLGKDRCTLTVTDTLTDFPQPDRVGAGTGSTDENHGNFVFDSGCVAKKIHIGVEPLGAGKGFHGPINVEGFSESIDFFAQNIGASAISGIRFRYLGKEFNSCDCEDDSSGLTGKTACRCEFDCPPGPPFARGFCGMHVTQFQKPDPSKDHYKLDIKLFDAVQAPIGATSGPTDAPANHPIDLTSKLPFVMIVTAQNVDANPIKFAYAGQNFDSDAAQCSVGAYDSGKREMDCGFTC